MQHFAIPQTGGVQTSLERWVFAAFLFLLPFQTRVLLYDTSAGEAGAEWSRLWFWASDLAFALLMIFWIRRGVSRKDVRPFVFLAPMLPALFVHPSAIGVWSILKLAEGLALFSYVRKHRSWFLTTMLWPAAFLVGVAAQSLVAVAQFVAQHDLGLQALDESVLNVQFPGVAKVLVGGSPVLRVYGITPHPNIIAAMLLAGAAVVAFLYIFRGVRRLSAYSMRRQHEELVRGTLLFLFFLALLLTFSRTAWLGAAVFFIAVMATIFFRASLRTPYLSEALRFFFLFSVIVAMFAVAFSPFLQARSEVSLLSEALDTRSFAAQEAILMIREHPWFGVGPGQFVPTLVERNPLLEPWRAEPVHNVVLLLAAEYGLPAMFFLVIVFIFLVLATWRRVLTMHDSVIQLASVCLLAFTTGVLFFSLGDHFLLTSQQGRLLLWFTLGLLAP